MVPAKWSRSPTGNSVNRRASILVSLLVAGWMTCPPAATAGVPAAAEPVSEEAQLRQAATEDQQTQERVRQLAELEAKQRARDQLEASHYRDLLAVQAARAGAWSDVLRTNWAAYQALLLQAAHSPRQAVPCTICNGRGSLAYCIVCRDSGKCERCNGTGKVFGEPCTTCRGSGKCFLCFGSGKMPCPFCDDGEVFFKAAPPSRMMPVPPAPAVQSLPQPSVRIEQSAFPPSSFPPGAGASTSVAAQQSDAPAQPPTDVAPLNTSRSDFWLVLVLFVGGILLLGKLAPKVAELLNTRLNPGVPLAANANGSVMGAGRKRSLSEFVTEFRIGPQPALTGEPPSWPTEASGRPGKQAESAVPEVAPLQRFLDSAPEQVQNLRKLLQEIRRTQEETARQELLQEVEVEIRHLKGTAGLRELLPVWQMACALDWLVKQLAEKTSRLNASTLRTVANGVEVLQELCQPGLRADLCTNPPIRLLAVDDDAICRHAISLALKKGVNQPDIASDGPAALAMVARQSYDVIFLDVEMPGNGWFRGVLENPRHGTQPRYAGRVCDDARRLQRASEVHPLRRQRVDRETLPHF